MAIKIPSSRAQKSMLSAATTINLPEEAIQASFMQWCNYQYPKLVSCIFHIPNGGHRHISVAAKLKKQGVRPGVADIFVMIPNNEYPGLWIEFKSRKGVQSLHQKCFEQDAIRMGFDYKVARSLKEAQAILINHLVE